MGDFPCLALACRGGAWLGRSAFRFASINQLPLDFLKVVGVFLHQMADLKVRIMYIMSNDVGDTEVTRASSQRLTQALA